MPSSAGKKKTRVGKNRYREGTMTSIEARLGTLSDVGDAASVYERSNLARRQGRWPSRAARVAQVTANLHDAADHDTAAWVLVGRDGTEAVAMALIHPFRAAGFCFYWFVGLRFLHSFPTRRSSD